MNFNFFIIKPKTVMMIIALVFTGTMLSKCQKVNEAVFHEEEFHATVIANQVLVSNTGGKSSMPYTIPTLGLKLDDGVVFDYTTTLAACANFPVGSRIVVKKKVTDLYPNKALENKQGMYIVGSMLGVVGSVIMFLILIGV